MSGKRRCFLYVTNETNDTGKSLEPTEVQSHVVDGPHDVTPKSNREKIVETKGTSGTATGSHVEQTINFSSGGSVTVAISCPFSSHNSTKLVQNSTKYKVEPILRSPSGDAIVNLYIFE
ncbi:conserved hypothetical protein [Tenacibaculum sp. 190524A05c]|uniref:hypothetical protein n=1 Tax=Tenacibaculum platacis TaxID=3137852 RepID=UPI0031FA8423